ncbi:MAG: sulfite exporter TauE/SafE family protein [Thaumarchaeota archaeon]|nr:sulfite exporter TauE/SafE family protein [Nitrososphaerota archaeon]
MESGELIIVSLLGLAGLFYTMGGFAGGSMFIAILLLSGQPPGQTATAGLIFNIFSTMSSLTRWRIHLSKDLLWFIAGSVPAAFFSGSLILPEQVLKIIMGTSIAIGGLAVIIATSPLRTIRLSVTLKILLGIMIGIAAGVTGIGGGVYLAPLLILGGIAEPKNSAATTTVFIMLNSLAGIAARAPRLTPILPNPLLLITIPVVIIAAQLGSYLGSKRLAQLGVRRIIGVILVTIGTYFTASSI